MSGLGLSREASWDQKRGIDPRICTTALILPFNEPASSSNTICSVSTSLATFPWSFTPLFKYLQKPWGGENFQLNKNAIMYQLAEHRETVPSVKWLKDDMTNKQKERRRIRKGIQESLQMQNLSSQFPRTSGLSLWSKTVIYWFNTRLKVE